VAKAVVEGAARTQIRREFGCFRSKLPENRYFPPKCLQQLIDFDERSFSPPGVLICEPDRVSPAPTSGLRANSRTEE
jgi:hypothetical protein